MLLKILSLAALWVVAAGNACADGARGSAHLVAEVCAALMPGDLIFKGADTALWTQLAAEWSDDRDRRWGHVGVVVSAECTEADNQTQVVHADTGTGRAGAAPGDEIGKVRSVSLAAFLSDVDTVGVFRLDISSDQRAKLVSWSKQAAHDEVPFDRGYSLESENNLYCTELVWRAMSFAIGGDAIPEKSVRLGRTYVSLSDLSQHRKVMQILETSDHSID